MARGKQPIMKLNIREVLEKILENKVKVSLVAVEPEFIHLDKLKDGTWRLTITKSLTE
jgi:hypothetical protein